MKVRFWGVRGSLPTPGVHTNRYGGNTSCVEIRIPGEGPRIIIDAGTGIRKLGKELAAAESGSDGSTTSHLLISHTHWDHIQGLPFFAPLYHKENRLVVYARQRDDTHLRAVLRSQTESPYFPVSFDGVQADVAFRELLDGASFDIGPVHVTSTRLNHPWIAIGYRLDWEGQSVAYITDTAPFRDILFEHEFIKAPPDLGAPLSPEAQRKLAAIRSSVVRLCQGANLVIYDAHFTPEEYRQFPHWGHSTPPDAMEIALEAGAERLALFHHAPTRTDDDLDRVVAACQRQAGKLDVFGAREGLEVDLGNGE